MPGKGREDSGRCPRREEPGQMQKQQRRAPPGAAPTTDTPMRLRAESVTYRLLALVARRPSWVSHAHTEEPSSVFGSQSRSGSGTSSTYARTCGKGVKDRQVPVE